MVGIKSKRKRERMEEKGREGENTRRKRMNKREKKL